MRGVHARPAQYKEQLGNRTAVFGDHDVQETSRTSTITTEQLKDNAVGSTSSAQYNLRRKKKQRENGVEESSTQNENESDKKLLGETDVLVSRILQNTVTARVVITNLTQQDLAGYNVRENNTTTTKDAAVRREETRMEGRREEPRDAVTDSTGSTTSEDEDLDLPSSNGEENGTVCREFDVPSEDTSEKEDTCLEGRREEPRDAVTDSTGSTTSEDEDDDKDWDPDTEYKDTYFTTTEYEEILTSKTRGSCEIKLVSEDEEISTSKTRGSCEIKLIDEHLLNHAFVEKTKVKIHKRKGRIRYKPKKGYCLYCDIYTSQIARHCVRKHAGESLVLEAMNLPKTKKTLKQRRDAWGYIRNMGNSKHNDRVYEGKERELIVKRRVALKQIAATVIQYVPCKFCRAYIKNSTLWAHKKTCRKAGESKQTKSRKGHAREGRMLLPLPPGTSQQLRNEIQKMRPDITTLVAKNDKHILEVGQQQLDISNSFKTGNKAREKMRTLGNLLISARKVDGKIKTAEDLVKVGAFNTNVKCTLKTSGYDSQTKTHYAYSTALRIGHALQDLARVVETSYILSSGSDAVSILSCDKNRKDLKLFMKLMQNGTWSGKVNASALRQRQQRQWKVPKLIPLTRDVILFHKFLEERLEKVKEEIEKNGFSSEAYRVLTETTLAQVVLFNRRRPAEVEEIEINDYERQVNTPIQVQDEVLKSLKIHEKVGLERFKILMVRGKRGKGVPILLTREMNKNMDKIANHNKTRSLAKKYIFARISDDAETSLNATEVIAKLAKMAKLEQPSNIRPTKLRKQLATLSQVINMKKNELEQLAFHMGHSLDVHKHYYRLPQEAILLAKVSKLLMLASKGQFGQSTGKQLDDIDVTYEDAEVDEGSDDEMDAADLPSKSSSTTVSQLDESITDTTYVEKRDVSKVTHKVTKAAVPKSSKRDYKYCKWTKRQNEFLFQQPEIRRHLIQKMAPGKALCSLIIKRSNGILHDKDTNAVRNKVHNTYRSTKEYKRSRESK